MRREGRQHGLVRTHILLPAPLNPKPKSRVLNQLEAPPAAGVFAKAPSKPTSHSKFTGRCGKPQCASCHAKPAWKSKGKAKGSSKLCRQYFKEDELSLFDDIDDEDMEVSSVIDLVGGVDDDVKDEALSITEGREIAAIDGEGSLLNKTVCASGDHEEDGDWFLVERI